MNHIEKQVEYMPSTTIRRLDPACNELWACLKYCEQQNGRPDCKNCGLDAVTIQRALHEAHQRGAQEALAKVEEWAKEGKDFYEWALPMATTPEQKSHYEENIEMSNELLNYLQQLKDNKV